MEVITLQHPSLGLVTGVQRSPTIHQYLGIKYAEIPGRFSDPLPCISKNIFATVFGPQAPQGAKTCEAEFDLIGQSLPTSDITNAISEVDCLTLNITVPAGDRLENLPVLVWVHGGNLQLGSSSWPQYDLGHVVETSHRLGKPIIGVSVNYRVGVLGFLTSTKMLNAGYTGNYGYKDLVVAFEWLQQHIQGFGGNQDNITAMGESAGGAAVTTLLWQEKPLFTKLIAMGGTCCLISPAPLEVHDSVFKKAMDNLGLSDQPFEGQLAVLLAMPLEDLVTRTFQKVPALPVVDGSFLPKLHGITGFSDPEDLSIPGKRWCDSMIIGDSKHDGIVMSLSLIASNRVSSVPTTFPAHLKENLSNDVDALTRINTHYPIKTQTTPTEALDILVQMVSDVGFLAPAHYLAAGFPGKSYVYHFNYLNPWDGIWGGKASHILDAAIAFGNYNSKGLDQTGVETSDEMQKAFVCFLNGEEPWKPFQKVRAGPMRLFGNGRGRVVSSLTEAGRHPEVFDIIDNIGWSKWWVALLRYL
ncbi:hypothetical protein DRE_01237 [Drechslerella stenobrocha 248]|uniref:Carboxylesterase type B domain-containing protein n=1 Tax=Drechslerella stenobrocha 248 TaxID=1043628 RepID=W7HK68_9PEZI|nr:hypothetical protein DRE_01237 [Drechslerella stenobrocha 248]